MMDQLDGKEEQLRLERERKEELHQLFALMDIDHSDTALRLRFSTSKCRTFSVRMLSVSGVHFGP